MGTIADILNRIDSGDYAMPQFQRGYVWNRAQVRKLMTSLYKGYPVGTILLWQTPVEDADIKGEKVIGQGAVNLILDGQQRMTSLYASCVARNHPSSRATSTHSPTSCSTSRMRYSSSVPPR